VLVDEHPLWLDAVEQVLMRVSVEVVGKATSFAEATRLVEEREPDLLVVETATSNQNGSGISFLSEIHRRFPDIRMIVLSVTEQAAQINAAFAAGAVAFVVKKAHPDDLAVAVRQAYDHSIYLPGVVVADDGATPAEQMEHPDLTRRELEILRLVAEGMSNAELARMLWVTEQTVKFHLSNIYRKLAVSNRTEASRWAQLNGLLPAEPLRAGVVA
jgi:DNA-binding NarL/FixJ family response regulator